MADKREISLRLNIEGISNEASELAKLETMLKNLNEERTKFMKEITKKGHLVSNQELLVLAAYDRSIKETGQSISGLKKVVDTAKDSLERKRQKLIEMKKEYAAASEEVAKKMAPAINKLNSEISRSEQAIGVHSRNVGNYKSAFEGLPGPLGRAATGVNTLGSAFKALLANPVALILTAIAGAIMALINAFKSSDSGAVEFASRFEQIKAILDVVRQRLISVTDAIGHVFKGEWKQAATSMKEAFIGIGEQIREATNAAYEYQHALDAIEDAENNYISRAAGLRNKIAKLEYTAQDRTKSTEERRAALLEAIQLKEEEAKREQDFAKRRLDNEIKYLAGKAGLRSEDVLAFIKMSDSEQANADQSLQTLRNNNEAKFKEIETLYAKWIDADTKFYEENKRNIGRLSGFEEEIRKDEEAKEKKRHEEREKLAVEEFKRLEDNAKKYADDNKAYDKFLEEKRKSDANYAEQKEKWKDQEYKEKTDADALELKSHNEKEDKKKEAAEKTIQAVSDGIQARFDFKKRKLQASMEAELSNENLTEQQRAAIKKKYAKEQQKIDIQQAMANGAAAIIKNIAQVGFLAAIPLNILTAVQTAIQIATIKAQKYEVGGKINKGIPIYIPNSKDNLLIAANKTEAVVNERQIAALGGTRAMRRAGVPGFAEGGAISNMPYINPSMPAQESTMMDLADRIGRLEVHLDMHKVRSGMNELDVTLEHQRI